VIKKRSVNILGHETSISMEEEFWHVLKDIAERERLSINKIIANIDDARDASNYNLSSAIRVYILNDLKSSE